MGWDGIREITIIIRYRNVVTMFRLLVWLFCFVKMLGTLGGGGWGVGVWEKDFVCWN